MDDAMTRRSATGRDFEDRFFELLLKRMDDQDEKLDEIVKQTRKTNGRVTKLEDKVEQIEKVAAPTNTVTKNPLQNPKFVQVLMYSSIALLLLVAAATGFDVRGLFS